MSIFRLCASAVTILLVTTTITLGQAKADSVASNPRSEQIAYLSGIADTSHIQVDFSQLPEQAYTNVSGLNLSGAPVGDVLRAIGRQYDLNVIVENSLEAMVTLRLSDIPVIEALIYIVQEYNLKLTQSGSLLKVSSLEEPADPLGTLRVEFKDGLLTIDASQAPLDRFVRLVTERTGSNLVLQNGVSGTLDGYIQQVPLQEALQTILSNNGYSLREGENVWVVSRLGYRMGQEGGTPSGAFWINVDNDLVSMDVVDAPITDIVREISYQSQISIITYGLPEGVITAKTENLTIDQTLNFILRGTTFTFRKESDIYIIGDKSTSGIATNKLIRLEHLRSDVVLSLIPESIKGQSTIQVVKEQNGLLVIGTNDIILELENFITEIDHPTPQIMIEALVVDVQTSDMYQLGVSLSQGVAPDSSFFNPFTAFFGQGQEQEGGLTLQGRGTDVNNVFATGGNLFGIANLGKLPNDFFFRIQALDQQGVVNIRSRPQISTLNGYKASIEIGTTQYYLLTSTTPLQSPNQIVTQESQRFEQIEANVLLEITPWVSSSGEVTAVIHPEFNTPVGQFNPDIPPTINSRILDSTVRLRDGETIILGGLIQESESETINKVPILGSIPLLGRLFRNKSTSVSKSELVIFITPHVFYGDESDSRKWQQLREQMDLSIDN